MTERPTLYQFIIRALLIAATSFGGGMGAHYYHHFVDRHHWLTREQFFQDMTLAQLLPGPNMVNLVAIIGQRFFGPLGAALATGAVLLPGTVLLILMASAIAALQELPATGRVMTAISAGAVGLLGMTVVRLAPGAKGARFNLLIGAAVFLLIVVGRLPMVPVVLAVAPLAIWLNRPGTR
ncbi:MAG: chromate transporter [Dehalococcoidia bacterium]